MGEYIGKKFVFFTVIIPVYNAEGSIERTIKSVLDQSFTNFEIIIVDDASNDNSVQKIECILKSDTRIRFFKNHENKGVAYTRNIGINNSYGKYITFLDSDDIWKKNKLQVQYDFILKNGAKLVFSNYEVINNNSNVSVRTRLPIEYNYNKILNGGNPIGLLTAAVSRRSIGEIRFRNMHHEDYFFWLELTYKKNIKGFCLQIPLAVYSVKPNSLSGNKFISFLWTWSIYLHQPGVSFIKSCKLQFLYALNIFRRSKVK